MISVHLLWLRKELETRCYGTSGDRRATFEEAMHLVDQALLGDIHDGFRSIAQSMAAIPTSVRKILDEGEKKAIDESADAMMAIARRIERL